MTQSLSNKLLGNKTQKLDPHMSYAWMRKTPRRGFISAGGK